jgi:hypothetical protein
MNMTPSQLALEQALSACAAHKEALIDALTDMGRRHLTPADIETPAKDDRRLLDQFAYRFTRPQDDMGAKLLPAILRVLGEDITPMSVIDRLHRLEQLHWLDFADEWLDLRRIRNEFSHDYPETAEERFERLKLATQAAQRLLAILDALTEKLHQRATSNTAIQP